MCHSLKVKDESQLSPHTSSQKRFNFDLPLLMMKISPPHQSNSHTDKNDDRAKEVCEQEESGDEDAGQCNPEVPHQLPCDHLVCLPAAVLLQIMKSERSGKQAKDVV